MSTGNSVGVAALVMLAMLCGPGRTLAARLQQSPPPPDYDQDDPLPPPPPDAVQYFPPPVHHRVRPNASSPLHPPSHPPPARLHRSPPPPPSSPPPPPPEEDRLHSRRLLTECADAPAVVTPLVPYGGGYVPVGAPYQEVPVSSPAPSPASGGDGASDNQPAGAPLSGGDGNSTLAHTTMVSAMKFNQCTYTIITCTGNIEGASTQADVNVEFFDKSGDSVLFVNLRNQNRNFNRGATDTFTVVGDCVPNICRMHLSHDDSGPNPGWFVNTVTVSLLYQTHVFNVFEWLSKDEPPYSLSRTVSSCPA